MMKRVEQLNQFIDELKKEISEMWDQDLIREAVAHSNEIDRYFVSLSDSAPTTEIDIEVTRLQLIYNILGAEIKRRGFSQWYLDQVEKNV